MKAQYNFIYNIVLLNAWRQQMTVGICREHGNNYSHWIINIKKT